VIEQNVSIAVFGHPETHFDKLIFDAKGFAARRGRLIWITGPVGAYKLAGVEGLILETL
jgi:hypothetical protein